MLNETYRARLGNKSVIRETFMYGKKRAAEIGYENVFDYSLGNPACPARRNLPPPCRTCWPTRNR